MLEGLADSIAEICSAMPETLLMTSYRLLADLRSFTPESTRIQRRSEEDPTARTSSTVSGVTCGA